jgi:DNA-binding SARP family transcriptional activator
VRDEAEEPRVTAAPRGRDGRVELRLLGRFALAIDGAAVAVSRTGQRVLARIALSGCTESRTTLAGTLWPEHPDPRAQANLRGALWRLPAPVRDHMVVRTSLVGFDDDWIVDLATAEDVARSPASPHHGTGGGTGGDAAVFRLDLLPDWDEPWLVVERERHRQLRLHALEDLAARDLRDGRPLDAIDCALLCVAAEPLRESAQALVIHAHLAAGNRAAALESFERFRCLLADELDVDPSRELCTLVAGLSRTAHPAAN